jgi:2-C-methyl-D-erythritol 4-phosphate cytidylyltransferase
VWGVVYAAGSGARFGGPKQFEEIAGQRLVDRCVHALAGVCHGVVVVLPPDADWTGPPVAAAVRGGDTNLASVRAGVAAVGADDASLIVLHSPSHPLASRRLVARIVAELHDDAGLDGVCAVTPMHDVLTRIDDDGIATETIDKRALVAVPVPFAFRAARLRAALAGETDERDLLSIVQRHGGRVATIAGEPTNIHVTTRDELEIARALAAIVDHEH